MTRLMELGYEVFVPFSGSSRVDLVAVREGASSLIQVKTGWIDEDRIVFNCRSVKNGGDYSEYGYEGEIDCFAVWCDATNKCYLVPIEEGTNTRKHLRLSPTRNGQEKGVTYAKDYEL